MKTVNVLTLVMAFLASAFLSAQAGAQETTRQVNVAINDAFIPSGFDSESDAYVVASGIFPNGCYQWNRAEVEHEKADNVHTVRAVASVSQGMCLMVLVPFTKEISLGQLQAGSHKVRFLSDDGTYMEKKFEVE